MTSSFRSRAHFFLFSHTPCAYMWKVVAAVPRRMLGLDSVSQLPAHTVIGRALVKKPMQWYISHAKAFYKICDMYTDETSVVSYKRHGSFLDSWCPVYDFLRATYVFLPFFHFIAFLLGNWIQYISFISFCQLVGPQYLRWDGPNTLMFIYSRSSNMTCKYLCTCKSVSLPPRQTYLSPHQMNT